MDMNAHRLLTTAAALAIGLAGSLALAASANAQAASYASEFERPYGFGYGEEQRPYEANSRDRLGNRVIINGMIEGGTGLGTGLHTGWGQTEGASGMLGSGTAVGNQLNVITNGSNNTIIIDSTQINNGDQTVVLNGELDF
jgi:holdfast attachment protein HfaA